MDLNTASPPTSEHNDTFSASPSSLSVSSSQMKRQLENQNKAAGPDYVLKACAEQLCGSLQHLFNLSLSGESSSAVEDILPCSRT